MARIGFKKAKYNKHNTTAGKYATLADSKVPEFEKVQEDGSFKEVNSYKCRFLLFYIMQTAQIVTYIFVNTNDFNMLFNVLRMY